MAESHRVLACLGDRSRFRMVVLLAEGDRCVTEIARAVQLSQSCTTRHLQVLLKHSIVSRIRQGKRVCFRLCDEDPAMASLLEWALLRTRHAGVFGEAKLTGRGEAPAAGADRKPSSGTAVRRSLAADDRPDQRVQASPEVAVHQDRPRNGATAKGSPGASPRDRSDPVPAGYQPRDADSSRTGRGPSSVHRNAEPSPTGGAPSSSEPPGDDEPVERDPIVPEPYAPQAELEDYLL